MSDKGSRDSGSLERRLRRETTGDVFFDPFNRGRYATDASFYQIMPAGVVVPRTIDEALRALAICRDDGRKVTPRGGGTSQCGQTVNDGIVVDLSKHLNRIISLDIENKSCVVEPGIVLDDLNRQLKKHDLWFPVDVSMPFDMSDLMDTLPGIAAIWYIRVTNREMLIDDPSNDQSSPRSSETPRRY